MLTDLQRQSRSKVLDIWYQPDGTLTTKLNNNGGWKLFDCQVEAIEAMLKITNLEDNKSRQVDEGFVLTGAL